MKAYLYLVKKVGKKEKIAFQKQKAVVLNVKVEGNGGIEKHEKVPIDAPFRRIDTEENNWASNEACTVSEEDASENDPVKLVDVLQVKGKNQLGNAATPGRWKPVVKLLPVEKVKET